MRRPRFSPTHPPISRPGDPDPVVVSTFVAASEPVCVESAVRGLRNRREIGPVHKEPFAVRYRVHPAPGRTVHARDAEVVATLGAALQPGENGTVGALAQTRLSTPRTCRGFELRDGEREWRWGGVCAPCRQHGRTARPSVTLRRPRKSRFDAGSYDGMRMESTVTICNCLPGC